MEIQYLQWEPEAWRDKLRKKEYFYHRIFQDIRISYEKSLWVPGIDCILSHYKMDCIVAQILYEVRRFWNKCIKKFNRQRKNITICDNCSSSFVIPKSKISCGEMKSYWLQDITSYWLPYI